MKTKIQELTSEVDRLLDKISILYSPDSLKIKYRSSAGCSDWHKSDELDSNTLECDSTTAYLLGTTSFNKQMKHIKRVDKGILIDKEILIKYGTHLRDVYKVVKDYHSELSKIDEVILSV